MIRFKGQAIQAAIFDMDGTMFDTERLRFRTLCSAATEIVGAPIAQETLLDCLGLSAAKARALVASRHGGDYPYAEIRRRADELELAHVRQHGVPIKDGLQEVLERLRKSGLAMAVATSSCRAIAEEYLINANVLKYFDITVCGDEIERGKPHPDIFLRAAGDLNLPPERCLVVEDSENGLRAAASAGGRPILIRDIKDPEPAVKALAFQAYDHMLDFLADLADCTRPLPPPTLTEPFPQTLNHCTVGIHGFGAIGGGYLTQIFSHWDGYTRPREIIAVTGNPVLRELVNAFGRFSIRYNAHAYDQAIDRVRLIDSADHDAVQAMYADSEIIGLSLPEQAIRQQAPLIAHGLLARHERNGRPLTVLTILNKLEGSRFVRRCVRDALTACAGTDAADAILAKTHFPETVVNRIVSKLSKEALLRQARIKLERFEMHARAGQEGAHNGLPGGAAAPPGLGAYADTLRQASVLANALGQLNLILFNSEPDMLVYAERGHPLLERLRQVRTVEDIAPIQTIKNRLWNGTHAIIAWYSYLLGYRTIGQGMGDRRVAALMARLIKDEIEPAMRHDLPQAAGHIGPFVQTLIARCRASFKDPCVRVGRDPLRKLQRRERVFGNIDLAQRHGLPTDALEFGAALGVLYALRTPVTADKECRLIRDLYGASGSVEAVLTYAGPYNGQPYPGLDARADAALIARIGVRFEALSAGRDWDWPLRATRETEMPERLETALQE